MATAETKVILYFPQLKLKKLQTESSDSKNTTVDALFEWVSCAESPSFSAVVRACCKLLFPYSSIILKYQDKAGWRRLEKNNLLPEGQNNDERLSILSL
jgi:hypothetical protein